MGDRREHVGDEIRGKPRPTHPLSGGVGVVELWVLAFERFECAEQTVVLRVGEFGVVEDMVAEVVVLQLGAQRREARGGFLHPFRAGRLGLSRIESTHRRNPPTDLP